jgi:glycerol-3-phosphate cytidylyltransferase-like family protein
MGLIKVKRIQVLSNGCLDYCHEGFVRQNQITFHEKDQKNFYLNQRQTDQNKSKSKYSFNYKKRYLVSK